MEGSLCRYEMTILRSVGNEFSKAKQYCIMICYYSTSSNGKSADNSNERIDYVVAFLPVGRASQEHDEHLGLRRFKRTPSIAGENNFRSRRWLIEKRSFTL
jgi:hypothetical protein